MQIYYDNDYSKELNDKLDKQFWEEADDRSNSIHLSDLCHCPVKVWCRLSGLPQSKDSGVGIMMIGVVGQTIIQGLYPAEQREYEPDKDLPKEMQIPSHIDIFADMKFPVEIKWSRKNIMRGSDIGKSWIMQVTGYMAKTNSTEGKMVIMNIITGKLFAFKVIMTEDELKQRLNEIYDLRAQIQLAVSNKDPSTLPIWEEECQYCDYRVTRQKTKDGTPVCPRYAKASKAQASQDLSPA